MLKQYQLLIGTICAGLAWSSSAASEFLEGRGPGSEDYLFPGQFVWSANVSNRGCYKLAMQSDGNLVTYNQYSFPLWSSGTNGSGGYARMQIDGNFVIYNWSDAAVWATNTSSNFSSHKTYQQVDGNLVVYRVTDPNGTQLLPLWASGVVVSDQHIMTCPATNKMRVLRNTNASGFDFATITPTQPRSSWCGYYCSQDSNCVAYTYAPPGTEQPNAVCHLKNGVPTSTVASSGFSHGWKSF